MTFSKAISAFLAAYRRGLELSCPVRRAVERTAEKLDSQRQAIDRKITETSHHYKQKARVLRERL